MMSKVFSALAVSVDGYITGRDPGPGRGLGDGGTLFDWYFDGDVPGRQRLITTGLADAVAPPATQPTARTSPSTA
jgi:hypothetical protein